jgi:VWFA-related protein
LAILSLGVLVASDRRISLQNAPQFRVDSRLVLVPVSVTDSCDRPVLGLDRQNFRVYEAGVEQQVVHFSREDLPLAIGFVFDTSMSMESRMPAARAAAAALLHTANLEDEFFLVEFQNEAKLTQSLTDDPRDIQIRLAQARAKGHTALLDAVHLGVQELRKSSKPRRALVILSDGGDNHSRYTAADVRAELRESDIAVYAMGLFGPASAALLPEEEKDGPALLDDLARQTGGKLFSVADPARLPEAAATIGQELHNRYVLAYTPRDLGSAGKYRRVQVRIVPPEGLSALRVSWRPGYYSPK